MSEILLFSDLHAHQWREFSTPVKWRKEMLNSRLVDSLRVIQAVVEIVRERKISRVVFAGDLFHRKRLIDIQVFNAVAHLLWRLAREAEVFLIAGNHDLVKQETGTQHALYTLKRRRIHVIDKPVIVDGVGMFPFSSDVESLKESLDRLWDASFLVMHAGVSGAHTGALEYTPLEPLTTSDLPNKPIFSGHYHTPQTVDQLTYIGAPIEFVRGEGGSGDRRFLIVDGASGEVVEELPYQGPRFVRLTDDDKPTRKLVRGNFVDYFTAKDSPSCDFLRDLGARGVNVVPVPRKVARKSRIGVSMKGGLPDLMTILEAYVDQYHDDLPMDLISEVGRELLNEALAEEGVPF